MERQFESIFEVIEKHERKWFELNNEYVLKSFLISFGLAMDDLYVISLNRPRFKLEKMLLIRLLLQFCKQIYLFEFSHTVHLDTGVSKIC